MNPQFARMPWYPRDFASATRGWPLIARAVYRELLDAQWDQKSLKNDPKLIRLMVGATPKEFRKAWPYVAPKFRVCADGRLRNERLEKHRETALALSSKRKDAAKARWKKADNVVHFSRGDPDANA